LGYLSGTALGYGLGDRGFESRQGLGIFLFTTSSRRALGPTQPPFQWVLGALSLGVKQRPRREADHSPSSSAEVKECVELYLHSLNTPSWRGAQFTGTTLLYFAFVTVKPLTRFWDETETHTSYQRHNLRSCCNWCKLKQEHTSLLRSSRMDPFKLRNKIISGTS
jgi:hypothetical protein